SVLLTDEERLTTILSFEHVVSVATENRTREIPHRLLILHEKDGLGSLKLRWRWRASGGAPAATVRAQRSRIVGEARQIDLERRSVVGLGVDQKIPAALFDDSKHSREA